MEPKTAILIVDDDPSNRLLIKKLLKNCKHEILEAEDGYEAISVYAQADVDGYDVRAIIMDYNMPGLNGDLAITSMCQYHKAQTGKSFRQQDFTTVVMFTANSDYKRTKCDGCQKCAVLVRYKPDDLASLKALVE